MKALLAMIAVASVLSAGNAYATDAKALAQKNGCLACHSIDKKFVGPSFKDVAAKYKGDKGAEARLTAVLITGAKLDINCSKRIDCVWEKSGHPEKYPETTNEDIKTIAQWVLAQ